MNRSKPHFSRTLIAVAASTLLFSACANTLTRPEGADDARAKLTRLQSNPELASRAPVAIKEAEVAVVAAEQPRADLDQAAHLVIIAQRKVDTALARAESRLLEDQRKSLAEQREAARLESRTAEADQARGDAQRARTQAELAADRAAAANSEAERARNQANLARMDTDAAQQEAAELQRQIAELNAKPTDRGLVVTLGDVLFDTGKADLKAGALGNLSKLVAFLKEYPDRTIAIEGHTDSVGSSESNLQLSQRRADAVRDYLMQQGIGVARLASTGKGEGLPIAGNDFASGRQMNRRVEVVIANTTASTR